MPRVTVDRTYLQQLAPPPPEGARALHAGALPANVTIGEEVGCTVATYRTLYREVGRPYFWLDRLAWSDAALAEYLARENVRIWILRDTDGMGGYFELVKHDDESVEVAYFGLVGSRHGRGLGKALLSRAIAEGWRWDARRLWLHTCTLDGPTALPNYRARGFEPFKYESFEQELPED
jgi:GNAT superfamily N-acetyltransferase